MSELPKGAREAVEELVESLAEPLDRWLDSTDRSDNFKKSALMCALTKVLVTAAILYDVPAGLVIENLLATLEANGELDRDDDHAVH